MSRMINRLRGRVYGWFDAKDAQPASVLVPSSFTARARLALTNLEDRAVPAQITVFNTADSGAGSLRQAFTDANVAGADEIIFNTDGSIPGATDFDAGPNAILINSTLTATAAGGGLTITGPGAQLLTIGRGTNTGRGLYLGGANIFEIKNVTISGMSATIGGAAIFTQAAGATLNIENSVLSGNKTTSTGGAIYTNFNATVSIKNSSIIGNSSGTNGGALRAFSTTGGTLDIQNSTIANNTASNGGAFSFQAAAWPVTIVNSTITGNTGINTSTTAGYGGGFFSRGSTIVAMTVDITSSIVSGNIAANGMSEVSPNTGLAFTLTKSIFGSTDSIPGYTDGGGNFTGTNAAPFDAKLANLGSYGGTQPTILPLPTSDAINNGSDILSLGVDQRGKAFNGLPDIGAVDRQTIEPPVFAPGKLADVFVNNAATNPYVFTVNYFGAIDTATLGGDDISVVGPAIFGTQNATFVSSSAIVGGVAAKYSITPAGGTWDVTDFGTYTVNVVAGKVLDTGALAVPAGTLNSFRSLIASTFTVTNATDNVGGINPAIGAGTGTLRQAIVDSNAQAGTADSIVFDAGVFGSAQTISLLATLPTLSDRVTITGPGASLLTLTRGVATSMTLLPLADASGIVNFAISGITFNGKTGSATGTAITTSDENVTLTNVVITGVSTTSSGGGIRVGANSTGKLTLTNSVITGNTSTSGGGGISAYAGTSVVITNSTLSDNSAPVGGGISFTNAAAGQSLSVTGSTFSGNKAGSTSAAYGGGAINFPGKVGTGGFLIRNSTISGNSATSSGGGVLFRNLNGTVFIQNSTITNNTANTTSVVDGVGGGGVAMSTITLAATSTIELESTLLSGNKANVANGRDDLAVIASGFVNSAFSGIGNINGFTLGTSTSDLTTAEADIANLKLGGLTLNLPGTTKTHAVLGGSNAIGKGSNPTNVTAALTVDQLGNARVSGGVIDIGAFERVAGVPSAFVGTLPNVNVDNGTTNPYTFTVNFADDVSIDRSKVGDGPEIVVTGPGGPIAATFVSAPAGNAPSIDAVYMIVPPGGTWDFADNGTYKVSILANSIFNTLAIPAPVPANPNLNSFQVAFAGTYVVTNTNNSGVGSLRQAVLNANANLLSADTILFNADNDPGETNFTTPQTITLTTGELLVNDSLTITGPTGKVTVSGNSASRIFNLDDGTAAQITANLSNLSLTAASSATSGGTIRVAGEVLNFTDSSIMGSKVTGNGAGISAISSPSIVTLTRSTISGTSTSGVGGAIDAGPGGNTINLIDSTLSGNTSASGSAIGMGYGTVNISGSTLSGNSASGSGGALRFYASAVSITNSTVSGNTAGATGGGVNFFVVNGTTSFKATNSTFTGNKATTAGGGIARTSTTAFAAGNFVLESTIVAGNINATTPDMNFPTALQAIGGDYNLIGVSDKGNFTLGGANNKTGTLAVPLNPLLGGLGSNGGLTQTHAALPFSPAIDKGSNTIPLANDQRGAGFTRTDSALPDIGAYEREQGTPIASGTTYVNITTANVATSNPYFFTVRYDNEANISFGSLGGNDVIVTGPNAYSKPATFDSAVPNGDSLSIVAKYSVPSPAGGGWVAVDNGKYTITAQGGNVASVNAKTIATAAVGSFNVSLPQTFLVTNANDLGLGSLRAAITAANGNANQQDVVLFDTAFFNTSNKTITLATALPTLTDAVIITGPGKALATVVAATGTRLFDLTGAAASAAITISGLTLTGSSFTGTGGAINVSTQDLTLSGVTVQNATSSDDGGAIIVSSATGKLTLLNSLLTANKSSTQGGALFVTGASAITITNSALTGNTAGDDGGGIYFNSGGSLNLRNSTVSGNSSGGPTGGGGIYFFGTLAAGGFKVINSTIANNTAKTAGGGLGFFTLTGSPTIQNSTITGNLANGNGGGISQASGTPAQITSTIISGNTAVGTAQDLLSTPSPVITNSVVGVATGFTFGAGSNGNLGFGLDLQLGTFGANGGTTQTFTPAITSPVLDRGFNPALAPFVNLTTDQRGADTDVVNFPRSKFLPDIGATEVGISPVPGAAITTALVDVTVNDATTNPYKFSITYSDSSKINASTITGANKDLTVLVTGPNAFSQFATFVSINDNTNGSPRIATYQLLPPGGTWDGLDNGNYDVTVQNSKVFNTSPGNPVPTTFVDSFAVLIPQIFNVTNLLDDGLIGSLRYAIDQANLDSTPDIINFVPSVGIFSGVAVESTIVLGAPLPLLTAAVTINGPGMTKAIVDAAGTGRVLDVSTAPLNSVFNINNLTLTNGTAATGAGLLTGDEIVTLTNVAVTNNTTSGRGAGIFVGSNTNGNLTLNSSIVSGNLANSDGGGIYIAGFAGGNGTPIVAITNSTIADNSSAQDGGGLYFFGGGSFQLNNSTISGNLSSGTTVGGGGLYFFGAVAAGGFNISNSTIADNSASASGGGIVLTSFTGNAKILNSTITGNTSASASTTVGYSGGGLAQRTGTGTVTLNSTVIAGNTNTGASGRDDFSALNAARVNYSAIFDADGYTLDINSGNNIANNTPLTLGTLGSYGGPTQTVNIGSASILLNAADPVQSLIFDQRGFARVVGTFADIGAFERKVSGDPDVGGAPVVSNIIVNGDPSPNTQRSRLTQVVVNFAGSVDAATLQNPGAVFFTRTGVASNNVEPVGTIVNNTNGLIIAPASGMVTSITLTFQSIDNAGIDFGSLSDGRWQLSIVPAGFTSANGPTDIQLRRLFGDTDNSGNVDGTDFGTFPPFGATVANPFDFNNDANIDGGDFGEFGGRFGYTLA